MYKRAFAAFYDRYEQREHVATAPVRRKLLAGLEGEVLELGAGTGANFAYYPPSARVTATDYSGHMLRRGEGVSRKSPAQIALQEADAMHLPFADASFDVVVAVFVFCSLARPRRGLAEAFRVLKSGGELRLFEHVRSKRQSVARLQWALSPVWSAAADGCRLDRDIPPLVSAVGFAVESVESIDLDITPRLRREIILARKPRELGSNEPD